MILFDTETTGLIKNGVIPLAQQPSIIEFAALRLDDETLEEKDHLTFLARPPILPLDPEITKITGIKTEDLKDELPLAAHAREMTSFFLGEETLVAHNAPFDVGMLLLEMKRLDRVTKFPWPPRHICTGEITNDLKERWLHQEELFEIATGEKANQSHRALDDVRQLASIVRWLREEGRL